MTRELTQAQLQEYWDACLIKHWRKFGNLLDVMSEFERLTGVWIPGGNAQLLRLPPAKLSWKVGVRAFVASLLPKINDRLVDQPREKDLPLLKKLQTSKYTTLRSAMPSANNNELRRLQYETDKATATIEMDIRKYMSRNHDTDWSVTKASRRHTR